MLVAELASLRQFRLSEQPHRDPAPGEIQVRVKSIGICGSDLHYYFEGGIGDTPCVYPMVLGHEPAGVVVKAGAGVYGWSPGDRAILEPAIYCYHCEYCLTGHHNVCANLRFLSTPADPGFFRQFVNLPAANLLPLPPALSFEQGTLAEPLAVALHSLTFARPRPGETAVIFGGGPIGLLTLGALNVSGAGRVWVVEPLAHRRQMAIHMGADAVLDPAAVDVLKQINHDTGNRGADIAIDCAAKDGTMNLCLKVTRNAGRVVYTGIPAEINITLDFHDVRRKELTLFTVRRSNHETDLAVRLLRDLPHRFSPVLTHQLPMDRIGNAFDMLEHYGDNAGKVTITP
ncbi:MAG TPA: alcohol dehydrogenase catalytic domain-containing protein [Bryobacteraceae bacterium]|nr:alcohol dehydrogenase catalytic domain-containing protein [Bryobacteraceae bacterium]